MAVRTVFANESGNQPASQLDAMYSDLWNAATIPCTPSGTNAITLAPMTNANLPASYNQHQRVGFTAGNTSTGAVTAQIGSLGFLNVYFLGGPQVGINGILSGDYYELAYDPSLNGGAGGFWLVAGTPTMQLLNVLTASASASLSDTTSLTAAFGSYEIVLFDLIPASSSVQLLFRVHSGGSFQVTSYLGNALAFSLTAVVASVTTTYLALSNPSPDVANATGLSGSIRIFNPSGSSFAKKCTGSTNYFNTSSGSSGLVVTGFWNSTGIVDGFQVVFNSGNIASGVIKVYGIQ